MNRLRQFWLYAQKVFDLPARLARVRNRRPYPCIPTRALTLTFFLGGLLRIGSRLGLEIKSRKKGWQRLVGYALPISDDALGYALERYDLEDLRALLLEVNQQLKRNKALESCKLEGLLVVAMVAWLLLRVLALNLFDCFARLHGKLWRQGRLTLQSIGQDLLGALERFEELAPLWSG